MPQQEIPNHQVGGVNKDRHQTYRAEGRKSYRAGPGRKEKRKFTGLTSQGKRIPIRHTGFSWTSPETAGSSPILIRNGIHGRTTGWCWSFQLFYDMILYCPMDNGTGRTNGSLSADPYHWPAPEESLFPIKMPWALIGRASAGPPTARHRKSAVSNSRHRANSNRNPGSIWTSRGSAYRRSSVARTATATGSSCG